MDDTLKEIRDLLYDINNKVNKYISKDKNNFSNEITIDSEKLIVTVGDYVRNLTKNECIILEELIKAENNFCSYEYLSKIVYGYKLDSFSLNSLRATISRLRKKTNGLITIKGVNHNGIKIIDVYKEKKEEE